MFGGTRGTTGRSTEGNAGLTAAAGEGNEVYDEEEAEKPGAIGTSGAKGAGFANRALYGSG